MIATLLGHEGFMKGMALYVERHDGTAATCDDFVAAMADANNADLDLLNAGIIRLAHLWLKSPAIIRLKQKT